MGVLLRRLWICEGRMRSNFKWNLCAGNGLYKYHLSRIAFQILSALHSPENKVFRGDTNGLRWFSTRWATAATIWCHRTWCDHGADRHRSAVLRANAIAHRKFWDSVFAGFVALNMPSFSSTMIHHASDGMRQSRGQCFGISISIEQLIV